MVGQQQTVRTVYDTAACVSYKVMSLNSLGSETPLLFIYSSVFCMRLRRSHLNWVTESINHLCGAPFNWVYCHCVNTINNTNDKEAKQHSRRIVLIQFPYTNAREKSFHFYLNCYLMRESPLTHTDNISKNNILAMYVITYMRWIGQSACHIKQIETPIQPRNSRIFT